MSDTKEDVQRLFEVMPSISLLDFVLAIKKLPSVNQQGRYKTTLLFHACTYSVQRYDLASLLIDLGADPNITDADGDTPLSHVISSDTMELVEKFIRAGADPNIKDLEGKTALHAAVSTMDVILTKKILDAGADVNPLSRHSPLLMAVRGRDVGMVKLLLEYGASMHQKCGGLTPYRAARMYRYTEILRIFDLAQTEKNQSV